MLYNWDFFYNKVLKLLKYSEVNNHEANFWSARNVLSWSGWWVHADTQVTFYQAVHLVHFSDCIYISIKNVLNKQPSE